MSTGTNLIENIKEKLEGMQSDLKHTIKMLELQKSSPTSIEPEIKTLKEHVDLLDNLIEKCDPMKILPGFRAIQKMKEKRGL